jgi:hypothetical protein
LRKKKKNLYFLFWAFSFLSFTFGLGWHLSEKYFPKQANDPLFIEDTGATPNVLETREITPEERVKLPEISREELSFRERSNAVLKGFPTTDILKDKSRDLHLPPKELGDVGAEVGAIEELLDQNRKLLKEGLRFYRKCALQESLLTSVRALCLHNLKNRAKESGLYKRIRWNEFPENLHRIADRL